MKHGYFGVLKVGIILRWEVGPEAGSEAEVRGRSVERMRAFEARTFSVIATILFFSEPSAA